jgi:hypothetical protein
LAEHSEAELLALWRQAKALEADGPVEPDDRTAPK